MKYRARAAALAPILAPVLALLACSASPKPPAPPPPACTGATFDGASFTHCLAIPGKHRVTMVLGPEGGPPYRSLSQLALDQPEGSHAVAFAMNAGMFDEDGRPIGYYVEGGKKRHALNTREGWGNFHLMPNGVFYGDGDGGWHVATSADFEKTVVNRPDFGTQSGPMLVIDGKLHPAIAPEGKSLKIRNGVGVDAAGRAHFVISDEPVSFGKLARFFKDGLKCDNALFLDGSVSSLWDPEHGRVDGGPPLGPLIVVEKTAKAKK